MNGIPLSEEMQRRIHEARVVLVDDQETNIVFLEKLLRRGGYTCVRGTTDATAAQAICAGPPPDLVLLDLHMAPMDGMAVLRAMRSTCPAEEYLPIVFLSGDMSREARQEGLAAGATDFLTKPFDAEEVLLRIRALLLTRFLHGDLRRQNDELEQRVSERTRELADSHAEMFERLCRVASYRDDATSRHTVRVGRLSERVALQCGEPPERARVIGMAARLHDIGKVGISDEILFKPGRLSETETAVMRTHAQLGADALAGSRSDVLQLAETIARQHHEHWDGAGYPAGLSGDAISLAARIVAVVDVMDALCNDRPYRPAWSSDDALAEIARGAGSHFDPAVVRAMEAVCDGSIPTPGQFPVLREG